MTKLAEIKSDNRFPLFITNHPIFNEKTEIKKIFPEIGLNNFSEKIIVDNSSEIKAAADEVINYMHNKVEERIYSLTKYAKIKTGLVETKGPIKAFGEARKIKYKKCSFILRKFRSLLAKSTKSFITVNEKTGKITLNIQSDIIDNDKKVVFKKGEGLFRVYQKINELLRDGHFLPLESLDTEPSFKKFNSVNIPGGEARVVFSSTGIDGAWDIATMSMRGISSCQTWGQGNSNHLVGSIVDPCTAIMYLTSGSNYEGKGPKMNRRCIVRFVVNGNDNIPSLVLERMYPSHNKEVANKFISILKEKTGNKFPIINCTSNFRNGVNKCHIPLTPIVSKLDAEYQPYRDSAIQFKKIISNRSQYIANVREQLTAVPGSYATDARKALNKVLLKELSSTKDKEQWRLIRSGNVSTYYVYAEVFFILNNLINNYIKNIKDTNVKIPIITLAILENIFCNENIDKIADSAIERLVKDTEIKLSDNYKLLLKTKIKNTLCKKAEKDRASLISKVEKIKGSKYINVFDSSLAKLIDKIS